MSVIGMEKLTVITTREDADALMRRLMKLRSISLERTVTGGEEALSGFSDDRDPQAAARAAAVDAVLPVLTKRSTRKKPLLQSAISVSFEDFCASGRCELARKAVSETQKAIQALSDARASALAEQALMQSLLPYLDFDCALDDPGTGKTSFLLGALPAEIGQDELKRVGDETGFAAEVISADRAALYIDVIYLREQEEDVLKALSGLGFQRAAFRDVSGKAAAVYDAAARREGVLEKEIARWENRLDGLSGNLTDLEILSDLEHTTLLAEENKRKLAATDRCTVLTGWCPVSEKNRVIRELSGFCAAYEFEPPAADEEPPVLLHNNGYARNFEWVLGMYSYPRYGKFDPTFIMSLFYFLIFGLMFADAGYGLLLSLLCFGAVRKFHPREGMKRFLLMFGYCGISCIICGILFGAYFGDFPLAFMRNVLGMAESELPRLSILPSEAANLAVLFDPLQNPMAFLFISLGVGALHLVCGMFIKAVLLIKDGHLLDAVCDVFIYYVLFAGVGVLFVNRTVGAVLAISGAVGIFLTQGRHKKGVVGKLIGGLGGLYGLINYVSDLLSYSRILALGLAAGVIGQVVNILATLKGPTFIGFLMMIIVFCLGHVLNLAINVLGTFVHTSRLQYIEFFGKFYEDGGVPFKPITQSEKYTEEKEPLPDKA